MVLNEMQVFQQFHSGFIILTQKLHLRLSLAQINDTQTTELFNIFCYLYY